MSDNSDGSIQCYIMYIDLKIDWIASIVETEFTNDNKLNNNCFHNKFYLYSYSYT